MESIKANISKQIIRENEATLSIHYTLHTLVSIYEIIYFLFCLVWFLHLLQCLNFLTFFELEDYAL